MLKNCNLAALFEKAPGFIVVLRGPDHVLELANESFFQLICRDAGIGQPARLAVPELASQGTLQMLDEVFASGEARVGRTVKMVFQALPGGPETERYVDYVAQPVRNDAGEVSGIFVQGNEVTEQILALLQSEAERQRTLHISMHDSLTGLPNRRQFHDALSEAVQSASSTNRALHVLFIDIDQFKQINDSLGHHVGDGLLTRVAQILEECAPESALVARLSGDEFGILCKHTTNAPALAGNIVKALACPMVVEGHHIMTGASIGVTSYPRDADTPTKLLINADIAMYHSKGNGRSQYTVYNAKLAESVRRRQAVQNGIRHALANDELRLHYQPVFAMQSGNLCSLEALIRWESPSMPAITPAELIDVAEDSGLIIEIGEWVVRAACEQIKSWHALGDYRMRVAINISPRQLKDPSFLPFIDTVLTETGIEPKYVELEITERTLVENNAVNSDSLLRLKERGIFIAVDDFGTGFSSLSYLKHFDVDSLKIDQSFVKGLPDSQDDAAIAAAVITMAHGLGIRVVAEGIEDQHQHAYLANLNCDSGQGFLYSRPLSAAQVSEHIESNYWSRAQVEPIALVKQLAA